MKIDHDSRCSIVHVIPFDIKLALFKVFWPGVTLGKDVPERTPNPFVGGIVHEEVMDIVQ